MWCNNRILAAIVPVKVQAFRYTSSQCREAQQNPEKVTNLEIRGTHGVESAYKDRATSISNGVASSYANKPTFISTEWYRFVESIMQSTKIYQLYVLSSSAWFQIECRGWRVRPEPTPPHAEPADLTNDFLSSTSSLLWFRNDYNDTKQSSTN